MAADETTAWTMPAPNTVYYLESGGTATLSLMLMDLPLDLYPTDQESLDLVLFSYGAWEDEEGALAALELRHSDEYMRNAEYEPALMPM